MKDYSEYYRERLTDDNKVNFSHFFIGFGAKGYRSLRRLGGHRTRAWRRGERGIRSWPIFRKKLI
jgi:hypothetical protein